METLEITTVTPHTVTRETLFCIKDIKRPGFQSKHQWFQKRYSEGLRLKILKDSNKKMIGFIEYSPIEKAWRPVIGNNMMFIHCMYVSSKKDRKKGYGSRLIQAAEEDAFTRGFDGLCTMTSQGAWLADKSIFERNGFVQIDQRGRFELMSKKWNAVAKDPELLDWTSQQKKYKGWHLLYADQCPWHEKSAFDLLNTALDYGIDLKVTKINSAEEAKNAPSGFGVFNLLYNGQLLEDHYISATRFKNILKKELKRS
jgi:GNAT superfamily N-acetyltransferase